jgi:hypothetical protein
MTYSLHNTLPLNPATSTNNGQVVNAYIGTRFSPVDTPPATNGAAPGGGVDYGPYTTNSNGDGFWTFNVTTLDDFIISYYDPADTSNAGSYNTYWLGPYLIDPSSNEASWTSAVDQSTHRSLCSASVAAGSNGVALPTGTINVDTTTPGNPNSFDSSGYLLIRISGNWTVVAYTNTAGGNSFTGCTGGSGTLATGNPVLQGYKATYYRRQCYVSFKGTVLTTGDKAVLGAITTVGGALLNGPAAGYVTYNVAAVTQAGFFSFTFPVDPLGYYGGWPIQAGTGTVLVVGGTIGEAWIEADH